MRTGRLSNDAAVPAGPAGEGSPASRRLPVIAVVSGEQARELDAQAIARGTPSRALMQRAAAAAAAEITSRCRGLLHDGVVVATGSGNNGGDGWAIARALCAVGIATRVVECLPPCSEDAQFERELALEAGVAHDTGHQALAAGQEHVLVDALLGAGFDASRALPHTLAAALDALIARSCTSRCISIDLPSGLDASTGVSVRGLRAQITLALGTLKRGLLVNRECAGEIVLLDIGLLPQGDVHLLTSAAWFVHTLAPITASAHKGTRGKLAIIGGADGMSGAAILAARAALRSGAGMVRVHAMPETLSALQRSEPAVLTASWPASPDEGGAIAEWADAVLVGPGLGGENARELTTRLLESTSLPVVLDADALNAFAGDTASLKDLLDGRPALLTPHPLEAARLLGVELQQVLDRRFEIAGELAKRCGCTVLLKGTPTIIARGSEVRVVAEGNPVLATGGSGDMLGGIAATLLAQDTDVFDAAALAAFAHGRAALLCSARAVRGFTLDDVLAALPDAWRVEVPEPRAPILAELPTVGEAGR